jgi:hypothetical protein
VEYNCIIAQVTLRGHTATYLYMYTCTGPSRLGAINQRNLYRREFTVSLRSQTPWTAQSRLVHVSQYTPPSWVFGAGRLFIRE